MLFRSDYLSAVNSGTVEGLQRAHEIMSNELSVLAKALGKSAPGLYDPLADHADLRDRVQDGKLSEADVHELAEARASTKLVTAQDSLKTAQGKEQTVIKNALEQVKTLGAQLKAADPTGFDTKLPFLETIIKSAVSSGSPPDRWVSMIQEAYLALPAINPAPKPVDPKPAVPDPLRPGNIHASGDLDKEPGNVMEAVDAALAR